MALSLLFLSLVYLFQSLCNAHAVDPRYWGIAPRGEGVCYSGIYGEVAPILKNWPYAVEYCEARYPVKCPSKWKREWSKGDWKNEPRAVIQDFYTTASSKTTAKPYATTKKWETTTDLVSSAWSKCQHQPPNVISTICSCIQPPKDCTTTTPIKTTTKTLTTTRPTTTSSSTTKRTTSSSSSSSSTTTSSSTTSSSSTTTSSSSSTTTSSSSSSSSSTTTTTTTTTTTGYDVSCPTATVSQGAVIGYSIQFEGNGVETNPATDSGNDDPVNNPPQSQFVIGDACSAIQQCATISLAIPGQYFSFDVHFITATSLWQCVSYHGTGQGPSDFTVENPAVGQAFGYSAVFN